MNAFVLTLALLIQPAADTTYKKSPTDDVWVYAHASDTKDMYLRAWGSGGNAVAGPNDDADAFAYSYLRWDLSEIPKGKYSIKSATLTFVHSPNPSWTEAEGKAYPLEVRWMEPKFTEKTWSYDEGLKIAPEAGPKSVIANGKIEGYVAEEKNFKIVFDLQDADKKFENKLSQILSSDTRTMALALTSKLDPQAGGNRQTYKVFSKDAEESVRPVLNLVLAPKGS